MRAARHLITAVAAWLIVCAVASPNVQAQLSGGKFTLPLPGSTALPPGQSSHLKVDVDSNWLNGVGYRPVRVMITPSPPFSDRSVTVRLRAKFPGGFGNQLELEVNEPFELRSGATVSKIISLPQHDLIEYLEIQVLEDGNVLPELSGSVFGGNMGRNYTAGYEFTALGIGDGPISSGFAALSNSASLNGATIDLKWRTGRIPPTGPATLDSDNLSSRWIDYTSVDYFVTTQDELSDFIDKRPQQWRAMRQAIAAGANLIVLDAAPKARDQLEQLLELPHADETLADNAEVGAADKADAWTLSPKREEWSVSLSTQIAGPSSPANVTAMMHSLGRGLVLAVVEGRTGANVDAAVLRLPLMRSNWSLRHGMTLPAPDSESNRADFWLFLLPGVGFTPVLQFQILITLFVLLIGPVNFILLKRWQRLNLLIFTTPIMAILATLLLVGYATLSEGFGVRVRARTFTEIDQRSGEAVCWSRLSYFAGLSPAQPLRFSDDVAAYPYRQGPGEQGRVARGQQWQWNWIPADASAGAAQKRPDMQELSANWLPARTPTQFMTVRARQTSARLDISAAADGQQLRVANRLGTRISKLLVRGKQSPLDYYSATAIPADTSVAASKLPSDYVMSITWPQTLSLPAGARLEWFQSNNYWRRGMEVEGASQGNSVLEESLAKAATHLAPGHFVAIVDRSPEAELGLDSVSEEDSLHVVTGNW